MKRMPSFVGELFEISLAGEAADVPKHVQVLRIGKFYDARYGRFTITPEFLLSLKKNFDDRVIGVDVAIDYAHASESVAAGWIRSLELTENNTQLWAHVEWTPNGNKVLSSKEFRYLSADIANDYEHNETRKKFGPTLKGAGLTNRPVIKGMAPVMELHEGEGADMDLEKENAELKAKIAELENQGKEKDTKLSEQASKIEATEKRDLELAEAAKVSEKKGQFDKMLSEGKVVEAQREAFMAGDTMKFAELAKPINPENKGHGGSGNDDQVVGIQDEIIKLAEEKVAKKEASDINQAIQLVLCEREDLHKKYEEETAV